MSARLMRFPCRTDPELLRLLEASRSHVMTKEERDAQRRSWVRGELMLEHPDMTIDEANALIDAGDVPARAEQEAKP